MKKKEEPEEEEDEPEEEGEPDEDEDEDEEVEEIQIAGTLYYTSNNMNGAIYGVDVYGEPGTCCGQFINGVPHFNGP